MIHVTSTNNCPSTFATQEVKYLHQVNTVFFLNVLVRFTIIRTDSCISKERNIFISMLTSSTISNRTMNL